MRKSLLLTFAFALLFLALPSLADTPAAVDQDITLDQIFEAEDVSVEVSEVEATVPADAEAPLFAASGGSCGGVVCGKGTYCCNASCGWCRPYGMSCIQIACN